MWFIRQGGGLTISVPLGPVVAEARPRVLETMNDDNASLRWSVLSSARWDGEEIVSLSARVPIQPDEDLLFSEIRAALDFLLSEATGCYGLLETANR